MSVLRSGAPLALRSFGLCLLAVALGSCASQNEIDPPEYKDAFGESYETDPITEQSVAENAMLHQHAQFDIYGGAAIPIDSNIDVGGGVGAKFALEISKNLYAGMSFSYSHHGIDQGAGSDLDSTEASSLYDTIDRYSVLLHFDYDVPLSKPSTEPGAWGFRFGLGAGLVAITGDEDPFLEDQFAAAGSEFELVPFFGFVLRPSAEVRYRLWKNGHLFANVTYDFVPQDKIDVKIGGDRREVDDRIQFDSINIGVGLSLEW